MSLPIGHLAIIILKKELETIIHFVKKTVNEKESNTRTRKPLLKLHGCCILKAAIT